MADAVAEFPEDVRAAELVRRRLLVAELVSSAQIAVVYLDARTSWLLSMWADGSLSREDLGEAIEQHSAPLLAGVPGGREALELLRGLDRGDRDRDRAA